MKRLLIAILISMSFTTPAFSQSCYDGAELGSFQFGTWEWLGGDIVHGGGSTFMGQSFWYRAYEGALTKCEHVANNQWLGAGQYFPNDLARIKNFFNNEKRKCKNHFTRVYNQYGNRFCSDQ